MKLKVLLILPLLIAVLGCSKDEPTLPPDWDMDDALSSMIYADYSKQKINTPKGWVYYKFVDKKDWPTWLQRKAESINCGYIMKAGSGNELLYFVYDEEKEYGRHYDAQGNPTPDNPNLNDWTIIYKWPESFILFTPKGWVGYNFVEKEKLPAWMQNNAESIAKGYIMMAVGSNELFFVYDEGKKDGQYYDAQGNPTPDNPKIKHWRIIHRWDPSLGLLTPKGWADYRFVNKEELPAGLLRQTESIAKGYIVKTYNKDGFQYFVYDEDKKHGKYYDMQGNPTPDNPYHKYLVIIYKW